MFSGSYRRLWLYAIAIAILIFLLLPIIVVIPMSFSAARFLEFPPQQWSLRWYESFFKSPEWIAAIWVSLRVGFFTVMVSVPLGIAAAYGLNSSLTWFSKL